VRLVLLGDVFSAKCRPNEYAAPVEVSIMVFRSRFMLVAVTMATASLVAACDGGGGNTNSGGGGSDTSTTGSGGDNTGGAATTTSVTTGSGGTGGTVVEGCQGNADCTLDNNGPICDPATGECVSCIPVADPVIDCGIGSWCVPNKGACEAGCTGDTDCPSMGGGAPLVCDLEKHVCVGCLEDAGCPAGSICLNEQCLPGCSGSHPCQPGLSCCGQQCFDLAVDENNCGACNSACGIIPHSETVCLNGQCQQGICSPNYADCNGLPPAPLPNDGCETNTIVDGNCVCNPGDSQSCYLGAPGSQNIAPCKAGTQSCLPSGLGWGPCMNQVLPSPEICANNIDENCDGIKDNATDMDNDGWTSCEGDCDDTNVNINPGAFEVTYTLVDSDNNPATPPVVMAGGNGVDDDCDPATSDTVAAPACGPSAVKLTGVSALDVANAMELCQSTTANPPKPQKKWGLLAAEYKLGNGTNPSAATLTNYQNNQAAILTQYGTTNLPKKYNTMAGISSGRMRYTGQTGFVSPNGGTSFNTASSCPAAYLAAHAGNLPSSQSCNGANCTSANTCNDSIGVRLQIRVPTNAKSMSYDFKFYSGEFPEYTCTTFNDFYLALLTTGAAGIPADKNVSFDGLGNPVSVNNGFFDVCSPTGCYTCPQGTGQLTGTGMEGSVGGGTSWLTTDAPVLPGETITLDLMTFDVGDWSWDSLSLLDNFRWGLNATTVKTHE